MKLNIGAGYQKIEGCINIDIVQTGIIDVVMDIEKEPLPYPDNSVDEIYCYETLEHLGNLIFVMNEMWRVLKPSGILKGKVPGTWSGAIADPTHKRIFVPESFDYFTGINPKHPDQPQRPRNANYGIKPWYKIKVDNKINFELKPRKYGLKHINPK
jgi:SAM-dependent methyltransferase